MVNSLMVTVKKKWKILFHSQLKSRAIGRYSMKWWLDAQILFWIDRKFFYVEVYQISKSEDRNFPLLYWTVFPGLFHIPCWNHCTEFLGHKLQLLIKRMHQNSLKRIAILLIYFDLWVNLSLLNSLIFV